jgi:formate hydrogenlyase transcriptional activator
MGKPIRQIDKRTLDALQAYSWPGNIRELQNLIERGVILAEGETFRLDAGMLPHPVHTDVAGVARPAGGARGSQRAEIEAVLKETRGRVSGPGGAAARLGIPASTLESKIRALKINKHLFRGGPEGL